MMRLHSKDFRSSSSYLAPLGFWKRHSSAGVIITEDPFLPQKTNHVSQAIAITFLQLRVLHLQLFFQWKSLMLLNEKYKHHPSACHRATMIILWKRKCTSQILFFNCKPFSSSSNNPFFSGSVNIQPSASYYALLQRYFCFMDMFL